MQYAFPLRRPVAQSPVFKRDEDFLSCIRRMHRKRRVDRRTVPHPKHLTVCKPVLEYFEDVLKGERVTKPLVLAHGGTWQWFRHPYLQTGRDLETKHALEAFLAEHGYRIAPVTIDNGEWIFAQEDPEWLAFLRQRSAGK